MNKKEERIKIAFHSYPAFYMAIGTGIIVSAFISPWEQRVLIGGLLLLVGFIWGVVEIVRR
jgi:hypothetical protein